MDDFSSNMAFSPAHQQMLNFRKRMEYFAPRIKKVAYLKELEFVSKEKGEFEIVARWQTKAGEDREFRKEYTRSYVLGIHETSTKPRAHKATCRFRDDFIREVMEYRLERK